MIGSIELGFLVLALCVLYVRYPDVLGLPYIPFME